MLTRHNSTNIVGLVTAPIRSFVTSGLLVADRGSWFLGYVAAYVVIVMRLEQRLGTPRTIVVWICAHVGGSILTVTVELIAVHLNIASEGIALTADVGVSYVMVGSMGAYLLYVSKTWRYWYIAGLCVGIVFPAVFWHSIWDIGHFMATCVGLVTGVVVSLWGSRPPMKWREMANVPPRPLPQNQFE